ncbi:MAG TPA: MATE family efflux transporter [Devosiaceae bacterium]|nr:MATE family efflux transporter [Devosiaceae bacterium]
MNPATAPAIRPFAVTHRAVLAIAVPASLALITEPLVGVVDTVLVGRLGEASLLGGVALGAVGFDILFATFFFLRLGTAGLVAQSVGAEDRAAEAAHLARALLIALVAGALTLLLAGPITDLTDWGFGAGPEVSAAYREYFAIRLWSMPMVLVNFSIAGWLYGRGDARTALVLALITNTVNAGLSAWLVLEAGLGVAGVAWGTVAAQLLAAVLGLAVALRHYGGAVAMIALIPKDALLATAAFRRLFGLSTSLVIRSLALMAAFAFFSAQGARAGATVLAANAILLNFFAVTAFFLDGIAAAAEQLCGKAVGAGYRPAFRRATALSLAWGVLIGGALTAVLLLFGGAIIDLMTTAPEVREAARAMLLFAALTPLTGMPAFVADGVVTGATMAREMRDGMVVASLLFFGCALVLQPLFGMTGLWIALHLLFVFRAIILFGLVAWREPGLFPREVQPAGSPVG